LPDETYDEATADGLCPDCFYLVSDVKD